MRIHHVLLLCVLMWAAAPAARADDPPLLGPPVALPVREATVFKDGHAFLLRAGEVPVGAGGFVMLDRLPTPVLGTFWAFEDEAGAVLQGVRATQRRVRVARTALEIADLLAANLGAHVAVTDIEGRTFHARIVGIPARSGAEIEQTDVEEGPRLPVRGPLVLFEDVDGTRAMRLDRIREVVFRDKVQKTLAQEEMRNRLELALAWDAQPPATAKIGIMALENGLRWIPSYRVDLLDGGRAQVRLQATLVNDLTDLEDVALNLVIGVPTFAFADQVDPMALQAALAAVGRRMAPASLSRQMLSNAIMSQRVGMREAEEVPAGVGEVAGSAQNEDLYVFRVAGVTLRKGERLVLPVAEVTLGYKDVYTLDVPFAPPPEVWPQIAQNIYQNPQAAEAFRLAMKPLVMHQARITNSGPHPLTTAPALLFRNGAILAQGMMTYTSVGNSVDLPVTTAVDVHSKREEQEVERKQDSVRWVGDQYARVDMSGKLSITNYRKAAVHLEVKRSLLGTAATADHDGRVKALNAMEDGSWATQAPPIWWRWYSWPHWWYHFNSVSQVRWELDVAPGASVDLGYAWSYYWR